MSARERCNEILRRRWPGYESHNTRFERLVEARLSPEAVVLEAGCGRYLVHAKPLAARVTYVVGIDLEQPQPVVELTNVAAVQGNMGRLPFADGAFDVVICRSVMEHLEDPVGVFREASRVLRPGGEFLFMTPNRWHYSALISALTPHRFHQWYISRVEGRPPEDVFPTFYRANDAPALRRLAAESGLTIEEMRYEEQYPSELMFSPALFSLGLVYARLLHRIAVLAGLRGWIMARLRRDVSRQSSAVGLLLPGSGRQPSASGVSPSAADGRPSIRGNAIEAGGDTRRELVGSEDSP
jgi:SAM-dependent methyltransferase